MINKNVCVIILPKKVRVCYKGHWFKLVCFTNKCNMMFRSLYMVIYKPDRVPKYGMRSEVHNLERLMPIFNLAV